MINVLNSIVKGINKLSSFERVVILIVSCVLCFGVIAPSMISSNSTVAVWIGIGLCIMIGYVTFMVAKDLIKELDK